MIKMYCIFSAEAVKLMKGNRGKLAAQAGHAYLHAYWNATDTEVGSDSNAYYTAKTYRNSDHAYKIALVVPTENELIELQEKYKNICGTSLVQDAGFTVFDKPTITCLGIGPIHEEDICEDLKALKIFI